MGRRRLSRRSVEKLTERERSVGVDPDDEAGRWLAENDPQPPTPKSAKKSKTLHRWRQQQQRKQ